MVAELLIVLGIALLVFGSTRLPALARSAGRSRREFREGQFDPVRPEPDPPPPDN